MSNTENKTFQPLQVMLLFSLLRNYDLEEEGCTDHKMGTDWGTEWKDVQQISENAGV